MIKSGLRSTFEYDTTPLTLNFDFLQAGYIFEEEEKINPSFQALKDLYGGEAEWSHHLEEFLKQRKEWDAHT